MIPLTPQRIALERAKLLQAVADREDIHCHLRRTRGGYYLAWVLSYQPHCRLCPTDRCVLLSELWK